MALDDILRMNKSRFEEKKVQRKIQEEYADCIKTNYFHGITRLLETTGIKPSESLVQSAYASYVKKENLDIPASNAFTSNLDNLQRLLEATRIQPSEQLVRKIYRACIDQETHVGLIYLDIFYKSTEIKPTNSVVQKAYATYIKKGEVGKLIFLYNITRIEPTLSGSLVQNAYTTSIRIGNLMLLKELQQVPGLKPTLSEEAVIQKLVENSTKQKDDDSAKVTRSEPFMPFERYTPSAGYEGHVDYPGGYDGEYEEGRRKNRIERMWQDYYGERKK